MRQQYHFRQSEQGLQAWDVFRLLELSHSLAVKKVPLQEIKELNETFWYGLDGDLPTCRSIAQHALLIEKADLAYPIILCFEGRVMDGMHRVCKALKNGQDYINAVQFEHPVQPDYIGVQPDDLPY
ncbi:hypothetical protein [Psychromonas ossibalaenae]|uniref:hypothetical protein n=1 Tax=Psychromonas ossibalaenae TaxID=444922 RepID=UPI00037C9FFD|nr:hypothetical protein [Psychromonas ossibalaenae]